VGGSFEIVLPYQHHQYPQQHFPYEFPLGLLFEGGYTNKTASGIFSANYVSQFVFPARQQSWYVLPFATVGYTTLVGTGNALNYGGGVDVLFGAGHSVRVEFRDYLHAWSDHDAALRIGWVMYIPGH
jgi:hypothetical protein